YWWDERDKLEPDQKRRIPPPAVQKPYPKNATLVELVAPENLGVGDMALREVIRRRKSHRKFNDESLTLEELSFLLWATQGVREVTGEGTIVKRTVPSAGGRHPFETYLLVNRVEGIEPGLYRYLPLEHKMYLVRADAGLVDQVSRGCREQFFVGQSAVIFLWTVIPYRSEWRYLVVAPKMIALDAGHLCQNLYLASEAVGGGTCAIGAYHQDQLDALLGVDGKEEFVVYAAVVGKVD
ncbi:SagB/ThcOx family dehydrogenase, partial [Candidatus Neomarinimicrobiota bacterium]